jgi:tetratricopeptide (TPR) repeat protein
LPGVLLLVHGCLLGETRCVNRILLVGVLLLMICAYLVTTVWAQSALTSTLPIGVPSSNSLDGLEIRLSKLEAHIERVALIGGIIVSVLAILAVLFGGKWIREVAEAAATDYINQQAKARVDSTLQSLAEDYRTRATDLYNDYSENLEFIAYHASEEHEEALGSLGWTVEAGRLANLPHSIQVLVLESLYFAKLPSQRQNQRAAFNAAHTLIQTGPARFGARKWQRLCRIYLRIAVALKEYATAEDIYRSFIENISDEDCNLKAVAIYRRLRNVDRQREILNRHKDSENPIVLSQLASLARDEGEPHRVITLLERHVKRIVGTPKGQEPRGWPHVLNSWIAVHRDLGRSDEALGAARFMAERNDDAVSLQGALQVAEDASKLDDADEIFRIVRDKIASLRGDIRRDQVQALVLWRDGEFREAIDLMRQANTRCESDESMDKSDKYFVKCLLGRLLRLDEKYEEAKQILLPAASTNSHGEADFELACVYLKQGIKNEVLNWVRTAGEKNRCFIEKAKNTDPIRDCKEVILYCEEKTRSWITKSDQSAPA